MCFQIKTSRTQNYSYAERDFQGSKGNDYQTLLNMDSLFPEILYTFTFA